VPLESTAIMHEAAISSLEVDKPEHLVSIRGRISVPEIAQRLSIGRLAVYGMLERGLIPGIRLGRRWIVTRHAFEQWERTCGTGFHGQPGGNV